MGAPVRSTNSEPSTRLSEPATSPVRGVLQGFVLPPERRGWLHERIGRDLSPDVYQEHPTGARLVIAPETAPNQVGGLYMPESVTDRAQMEMGAGWVIAVGPLVGREAPHPGPVLCAHPSDLLGAHVLYRKFSGTELLLDLEGYDRRSKYALIVLTDRDILTVRFGG